MKTVLMKCGCVAQGVIAGTSKPVCVVHFGLTPDAEVVVPAPELAQRKAICPYCKSEKQSDLNLPFFEYRANEQTDRFYCGCRGWD